MGPAKSAEIGHLWKNVVPGFEMSRSHTRAKVQHF